MRSPSTKRVFCLEKVVAQSACGQGDAPGPSPGAPSARPSLRGRSASAPRRCTSGSPSDPKEPGRPWRGGRSGVHDRGC